jgi:hypothetical protein
MGDRVLMQMRKGDEFGPVVYGHWAGDNALHIVAALKDLMGKSQHADDLDYCSARLVQCAIGGDKGTSGFGIWNATALLTEADSQGDAGCVLIDCDTFAVKCFGGYLKSPEAA